MNYCSYCVKTGASTMDRVAAAWLTVRRKRYSRERDRRCRILVLCRNLMVVVSHQAIGNDEKKMRTQTYLYLIRSTKEHVMAGRFGRGSPFLSPPPTATQPSGLDSFFPQLVFNFC